MNTSELTPPFALTINRIWPFDVVMSISVGTAANLIFSFRPSARLPVSFVSAPFARLSVGKAEQMPRNGWCRTPRARGGWLICGAVRNASRTAEAHTPAIKCLRFCLSTGPAPDAKRVAPAAEKSGPGRISWFIRADSQIRKRDFYSGCRSGPTSRDVRPR